MGFELADWPSIGRLGLDWQIGIGLADWYWIDKLVDCWHWIGDGLAYDWWIRDGLVQD